MTGSAQRPPRTVATRAAVPVGAAVPVHAAVPGHAAVRVHAGVPVCAGVVTAAAVALGALLAAPSAVHAQTDGGAFSEGPARRSIGLFGGYGFGYAIPSRAVALVGDGAVEYRRDWKLDAQGVFGVDGSLPVGPRFSILGSWRFESETTGSPECSGVDAEVLALIACDGEAVQGPTTVGYVGLGGVIGERFPVTLHAGPTVTTGDTSASRIGLLFGATLDIPTPRSGLALRLGFEDRLAFWRNQNAFVDATNRLERGPSHLLALRAGIAYLP